MSDPLLHIQELSAGYLQRGALPREVVHPFTTYIHPGTVTCLIGPNGAGKSTLLCTIAGMYKPLRGRVLLGGGDIHQMNITERARRLSVVLTQKMEVGLFTGYALVAMGRHPYTGLMGQLSEHDHDVVRHSIELVGAERLVDRPFNQMSDGERQKVLIARALAQEPDLLVLDEPTAYLDLPRRVECMALLRDLASRTGRAVLLSTHDLDLALRFADQIWLLPYTGQVQVGLPEDLVLSGAFETAFHSTAVSFDRMTGAFQLPIKHSKVAVLEGEGAHFVWTKRALEREGYEVVASSRHEVPVIWIYSVDEPRWQIINGESCIECHSVDALLVNLRKYSV